MLTHRTDRTPRTSLVAFVAAVVLLAACSEDLAPPTALIIAPETVAVGAVVQLDGSDSFDPQANSLSYAWQFLSVPGNSQAVLNSSTIVSPSFTADTPGEFVVELVVAAGSQLSAPATVTITVSLCGSQTPLISSITATPEVPVSGSTIRLAATVTDADNDECGLEQRFDYVWAMRNRPTGSGATIDDSDVPSPTFVADISGSYTVELQVTDSGGISSAVSEITIVVAECGEAQPVVESITAQPSVPAAGEVVRLSATWSDGDNEPDCGAEQTVTYSWVLVSRPIGSEAEIVGPNLPEPNLATDLVGDYVVSLTLTDSTGRTSEASEHTVTAAECGVIPPEVTEVDVDPESPNVGDTVRLSISISDADNDPDLCGLEQLLSVNSEIISQPAGSAATLAPEDGLSIQFDAELPGDYVVRTTVTDDTGLFSSSDTTISVTECGNAPPFVSEVEANPASPNIGDLVSIEISVEDSDTYEGGCNLEQQLRVSTRIISQPAGSTADLEPSVGLNPGFTADTAGGYVLEITVTDDTERSSTETLTITVSECGGAAPSIDLVDWAPTTPNVFDPVTLTITASDADTAVDGSCHLEQALDLVSSFRARPSGSSAQLIPDVGPVPQFVPDVFGFYVIRVTATDETGLSSFDDITVEVIDCGAATPTVTFALNGTAYAGQQVDLTVAPVDLDNACLDPDQVLTTFAEFVAVPIGSETEIQGARTLAPYFHADEPGDYRIEVTVWDDTGNSSSFTDVITVTECGLNPPTAATTFSSHRGGGGPIDYEEGVTTTYPFTFDEVSLEIVPHDLDNDDACRSVDQTLTVFSEFAAVPIGSVAELQGAETAHPYFLADRPGDYEIHVTVFDGTGNSPTYPATVEVSVCGSHAPTSAATFSSVRDGDFGYVEGDSTTHPYTHDVVNLTLVTDDEDNSVVGDACNMLQESSTWTAFSSRPLGSAATIGNPGTLTPQFVPDVFGDYWIQVTTTDDYGLSSTEVSRVIVSECGSHAPDPDVTFSSYRGGTVPVDYEDTVGTEPYTNDSVFLAIDHGDLDNVEGIGECGLGQGHTYFTELYSRPLGSTATITNADAADPFFLPDRPGDYGVRITVTDDTGRTTVITDTVTVNVCGSRAPAFDTGFDAAFEFSSLRAGATPVPYVGTVGTQPYTNNVVSIDFNETLITDADNDDCSMGQVITWLAEFEQRPPGSTTTILDADSLTPRFVADVPGTYIVTLTATDETGLSVTSNDQTVVVNACGSGSAPQATSTVWVAPTSEILPVTGVYNINTTVTAEIRVTLTDADIACGFDQTLSASYQFIQRPIGSTAMLIPIEGETTVFTADRQGTYKVRITAEDQDGLSTTHDVTIAAGDCGSHAPDALIEVLAPFSEGPGPALAALAQVNDLMWVDSGASTDSDTTCLGLVGVSYLTYFWSFDAVPPGSSAEISNATFETPWFAIDVPGVYEIRLEVSDGFQVGTASLTIEAYPTAGFVLAPDFELQLVGAGPLWNQPTGVTLGPDGAIYTVQNGSGVVTVTASPTIVHSSGAELYDAQDIVYVPGLDALLVTNAADGELSGNIIHIDMDDGTQTPWLSSGDFEVSFRSPAGITAYSSWDYSEDVVAFADFGYMDIIVVDEDMLWADQPFDGYWDSTWGVAVQTAEGSYDAFYISEWYALTKTQNNGEGFNYDLVAYSDVAGDTHPTDVAYHPTESLLVVAEPERGRVLVVDDCDDPYGDPFTEGCRANCLVQDMGQPWGLTFESPSELLVTDYGNDELFRFSGDFVSVIDWDERVAVADGEYYGGGVTTDNPEIWVEWNDGPHHAIIEFEIEGIDRSSESITLELMIRDANSSPFTTPLFWYGEPNADGYVGLEDITGGRFFDYVTHSGGFPARLSVDVTDAVHQAIDEGNSYIGFLLLWVSDEFSFDSTEARQWGAEPPKLVVDGQHRCSVDGYDPPR